MPIHLHGVFSLMNRGMHSTYLGISDLTNGYSHAQHSVVTKKCNSMPHAPFDMNYQPGCAIRNLDVSRSSFPGYEQVRISSYNLSSKMNHTDKGMPSCVPF